MIKDYRKGDLESGFIGVRVVVSVGGKSKQKWFSNKKYAQPVALRLAKETELKWKRLQLKHQRNSIISKRSNTGIKGLSFTFETKNNNQYVYPILSYYFKKGKKRTFKKWRLTSGFLITDDLWHEVCLFIKNTRTLQDSVHEEILKKKPNASKYLKVQNKLKTLNNDLTNNDYFSNDFVI